MPPSQATPAPTPDGGDGLFVFRLLELPIVLRDRSQQQGIDLLREMELIAVGAANGMSTHAAPARLLQLAAEMEAIYAPYVSTTSAEIEAALDRGEQSIPEVSYRVPPATVAFIERIRAVLAEVEEYCNDGGPLLAVAPDADIVAYREWSMQEVRRQYDGHPPTPWPVFAAERGL